ncbi:ABC transporter permease subunit [Deinococcus roseus]|uniref:ABC transporter ATP-binding protein n=1 Tax=Deinococcus roseus TaxID=392414 RepID=A0ABQ2D7B5_9DEIO|nr:ABC transporter permease subunit [Deinococcus roseus]GGJ46063.1 ABC transporter ATP-binding protein [Deinococcus roseus]
MTAAIELKDITIELNGRDVLRNVDLSIESGEFIAIIGASGGGKSTLLRVIAGLLKPKQGSVKVCSQPAFVFQDYRLLPWRTVLKNVNLPREVQGKGMEPHEALKQVGMDQYHGLYPSELSGGMRARVAVARALAQDSEIILMDEPFAALDALVRERFNAELKRLHRKERRTILFVTHSIREAVYLADRVVVVKNGGVADIIDTKLEGRVSAYTSGIEAQLRELLGEGNSTLLSNTPPLKKMRVEGWLALLALTVFLLLWHLLSFTQNAFSLPSPVKVILELQVAWGELYSQMLLTLRTTLLGIVCGMVMGVTLGYPLGRFPMLERVFSPFLVASQSTPIIAVAPLLIIWLGFGTAPAIVAATLTAFYPVMIATMTGVREVENTYHEYFDTLNASFWQRLWLLEAPGALPVLLGGLKLTASLALIGAVVWEFVSNAPGLGAAINQARAYYNTPRMFAAIFLLTTLGAALYLLVTLLERAVLKYRRKAK